jgi:hydrogenase maturation protease
VDHVARIAEAVLYEGYVLWPYRRSAIKNQRRWTFGGVYPEAHGTAHPDDPSAMQTECLVEGEDDARVDVTVRFLHVVHRQVARHGAHGLDPVDELVVDGERHASWDEACERELAARALRLGSLASVRVPIDIPAGTTEEALGETGAIVRTWRALGGAIEVSADRLEDGLHRLRVEISNATPFEGDREEALRQTFCSTHTVLRVEGGAFVSLTDPPERLREAAAACENTGTWPVLAGPEGERGTVLSSPIILPDHPEIAPESPGDLFDASEIDQLLTLSILSLTDEERQQMRAADPKARAILERTESLSQEQLMRLHGAVRELRPR